MLSDNHARKPLPLTNLERIARFGWFPFEPAPTAENPDGIRIVGDWAKDHIVRVHVPQLDRAVSIHKACEAAFLGLWADWEALGLRSRVLTFNGAWVPRYKRGKSGGGWDALSNHALGTAFDINAKWNPLGHAPAPLGAEGSVVELVPAAHARGFVWGGDFLHRVDGMHFEFVGAGPV